MYNIQFYILKYIYGGAAAYFVSVISNLSFGQVQYTAFLDYISN